MSPKYLSDIFQVLPEVCFQKYEQYSFLVRVNNNYFINIFFPSIITEWNKLDLSIRNLTSLNPFVPNAPFLYRKVF